MRKLDRERADPRGVSLPRGLWERLRVQADRECRSVSNVIKIATLRYLAANQDQADQDRRAVAS